MYFVRVRKIRDSFKKFSSSELTQLVWCLNQLARRKFTKKLPIPYTRLNFQICQFLMRRGFLSAVKVTPAKKTDYLAGSICVRIRMLSGIKKPFSRASLQEFRYTHYPGRYGANYSGTTMSWWRLRPYRDAKLVVVKTSLGLMTAHECVYYRVGGRVLLILY